METKKVNRLKRVDVIQEIGDYPFVAQDLARFALGDFIGSGAYRYVFEFDLIPNTVIKYCPEADANVLEMAVWKAAKGQKYAKWLAPCLHISFQGHFLIQRKCKPVKYTDKLPKMIPDFFTDIKLENFGWIGKQLVCHDYQFLTRAIDRSMHVMRKETWK